MKSLRFLIIGAIIAAMYAALTMLLMPISYGQVQFRVAEALTVLPMLTPAAIPGLFIGCIIANAFSPFGIIDVIFGSLASLIAAFLTRKMPKKYLAPLPPIIVNGVIIGIELTYLFKTPLLLNMAWVALGEAVVCYGLGYPLLLALSKVKGIIFDHKV